jgi:hypothetical protein
MAYTNLPPNLYDYFSTINQRIRKLESAPDQAMTTAVSAQSLALTSQSVATNAQLQAANASVQAVQAQSQATLASSQATYAVTTANGKNTVAYGTAAPPSGTHTTGDLYFQFNGSNQVIAQYTWNGFSWVSNPITSTVIASINAGTIVSGTITGIEFNNGSGTFHVTPAGALTASSANITGTIVAQSGYIGNTASGSYWSITSSGITGFGSANITGGLISGSSIYIGSSGQFQVDAAGNLNASSANITGTITATSGSFTGNIYSSNGTIGGFSLTSYALTGGGLSISSSSGQISSSASIVTSSTITAGSTMTAQGYFYNSGYATTTSSANAYINASTGLLARSSSSLRYKLNVEPEIIPNQSILALAPKSFIDKASADAQGSTDGLPRILGLIAEEIAEIPVLADLLMNKNQEGQPDSVNYDRVAVALIPLLKDHEARLAKLEGANGTTTSN